MAINHIRNYMLEHPYATPREIMEKFQVNRTAYYYHKRKIDAERLEAKNAPRPVEIPTLAGTLHEPEPVVEGSAPPAVVPAGENYFASENGKAKLATRIGSKMEQLLQAMTPEKMERASLKDLSISFGVMTDKQRQINDTSSSGQGILAAALIKAVAAQIGASVKLPEPTQMIPAEAVVVDE